MAFDPDVVAAWRLQAKAQLRKRMRALRSAIPEAAIRERSQRICEWTAASAAFAQARSVALFAPMLERHEVDVRSLDQEARRQGKAVLYPRLEEAEGKGVMSLRCASLDQLVDRGNRFAEPPPEAPPGTGEDGLLILVPALAVGPDGHRLGYGGGYYDRLLAQVAPPATTMVVAFHFQLLAEIPSGAHDRPVGWIVTEVGVRQADPQR